MKMKVLASGYSWPSFAPNEQRTAAKLRAEVKCFDTNT